MIFPFQLTLSNFICILAIFIPYRDIYFLLFLRDSNIQSTSLLFICLLMTAVLRSRSIIFSLCSTIVVCVMFHFLYIGLDTIR